MRFRSLSLLLFVLYCLEAGTLLFLTPWTTAWDRAVTVLPWTPLHSLLLDSAARALISAFGAVHLVWGVHDLHRVMSPSRKARPG